MYVIKLIQTDTLNCYNLFLSKIVFWIKIHILSVKRKISLAVAWLCFDTLKNRRPMARMQDFAFTYRNISRGSTPAGTTLDRLVLCARVELRSTFTQNPGSAPGAICTNVLSNIYATFYFRFACTLHYKIFLT